MADNSSDAQNEEMLSIPCYYVNKIFVSFSNDGFRISFGEQTLDTKYLKARTAILLSKEGVAQLQELCELILDKADEANKAVN